MKRIFGVMTVLLLCVAFICPPIAVLAAGQSWYCIRTKAHRQPPIPTEFSFVREYDAYFLDTAHGDKEEEKVVYLTFDVGYENGNVARVLDTLRDTDTPAAFFILKHVIDASPELVLRMKNEGHLICNHTMTHKNLSAASQEEIRTEIEGLEHAYSELTGERMAKYFRPPEGSFSRELLASVRELGYKTVFWSFAYADWDNDRQPSHQKALQCVMDNVHNGAVILLHPTSQTNAEILPIVIRELKEMGYRFGTLDELCQGS